MRSAIVLLLFVSLARAESPRSKPRAVAVKKPAVQERVPEAELLRYKAAYYDFKALEVEILRAHNINDGIGDEFDPDTGIITRVKPRRETKKK